MTELRRQVRGAKGQYKVVKNTLARRALKGTPFEPLAEFFTGTTAVAYSGEDPVALAKVLTTFAKTAPALQIKAAVVQGRAIKAARGRRARDAARQAGAVRQAAVPAAGADDPARERAQRRAARPDERAGAGGKEERVAGSVREWPNTIFDQRSHSGAEDNGRLSQQEVVEYIKGISVSSSRSS